MQNRNELIKGFLRDLKGLEDIVLFKFDTLWIIYQDMSLDADTMEDFKTGAIQYGIYQHDHIPFLLLKFGDVQFDFDINGFDLMTPFERPQLKQYSGNACFIMVEPKLQRILVE